MKHSIEAVYENGIFRPLRAPNIPNGQQVLLEVEPLTAEPADNLIELATQVYEGLSENDINEIEKITLERRDFFSEKHA